jgi:hypothetical protein
MKLNCEVAVSVGDTSGCAKFSKFSINECLISKFVFWIRGW